MIIDNKEGKLIDDENIKYYIIDEGDYVLETASEGGEYIDEPFNTLGEIIYPHGIVILENSTEISTYKNTDSFISFKSVLPLFTTTFSCKIKDYEYNFTSNPTSLNTDGTLKTNIQNSDFTPYITTVGLYNDSDELLAVAKLSQPLRKTDKTDTVIKIKLDF